jgi:hypothetical protein
MRSTRRPAAICEPDGRAFSVGLRRCAHSGCYAAWCECGKLLTAHAFEPEHAKAEALESLAGHDPLGPGHPPALCPVRQGALFS